MTHMTTNFERAVTDAEEALALASEALENHDMMGFTINWGQLRYCVGFCVGCMEASPPVYQRSKRFQEARQRLSQVLEKADSIWESMPSEGLERLDGLEELRT